MVEVFEYTLVLLASLMVGGFSLYAVGNYTSQEKTVAEASAFQSILSAASTSVRTGTTQVVVAFFDNETISCRGGRLSVTASGVDLSSEIGAHCSFKISNLKGVHSLAFRAGSGNLTLGLLA